MGMVLPSPFRKSLPLLVKDLESLSTELERAKHADLITLPEGVTGTNCGNCAFQEEKYCFHPEVDQAVTERECCKYWDAPGTGRKWEQGEKALSWMGSGQGGELVKPPATTVGPSPFRLFPSCLPRGFVSCDVSCSKSQGDYFRQCVRSGPGANDPAHPGACEPTEGSGSSKPKDRVQKYVDKLAEAASQGKDDPVEALGNIAKKMSGAEAREIYRRALDKEPPKGLYASALLAEAMSGLRSQRLRETYKLQAQGEKPAQATKIPTGKELAAELGRQQDSDDHDTRGYEKGPPAGLDLNDFGQKLHEAIGDEGVGKPLGDVYRAVGEPLGMSVGDFQRAIFALHQKREESGLSLSGWPKSTYEVPDPEHAMPYSGKLFYYLNSRGSPRGPASPPPAGELPPFEQTDQYPYVRHTAAYEAAIKEREARTTPEEVQALVRIVHSQGQGSKTTPLMTLAELRQTLRALHGWGRVDQDGVILAARKAGLVGLTPLEGRHRIPEELKAAAIPEVGSGRMGYINLKASEEQNEPLYSGEPLQDEGDKPSKKPGTESIGANQALVNAYENAKRTSQEDMDAALSQLEGMAKQDLQETFMAMGFRFDPKWSAEKLRNEIRKFITSRWGMNRKVEADEGHPLIGKARKQEEKSLVGPSPFWKSLADYDAKGRWVTMGGKPAIHDGKEEQHHGGTRVYIENGGQVRKGPRELVGRQLGDSPFKREKPQPAEKPKTPATPGERAEQLEDKRKEEGKERRRMAVQHTRDMTQARIEAEEEAKQAIEEKKTALADIPTPETGLVMSDWNQVREATEQIRTKFNIKVPVNTSSEKVSPVVVYATYRTLAVLPDGMRGALEQMGVTISIVHQEDEAEQSFQVAGKTFTKAGHANYRKKEIKIWTTWGVNAGEIGRVVGHEAGHFIVQALALQAAQADDDYVYYQSKQKEIRRLLSGTAGEPVKDDAEEQELGRQSASLAKQRDEALAFHTTFRSFDKDTLDNGGITPYADSYVKDQKKGWVPDIFEYTDEVRSEAFQGRGLHSHISRAGNENFAELASMMSQAEFYPEAKETLEKIQSVRPDLWNYFQVLWKRLDTHNKVPAGGIA